MLFFQRARYCSIVVSRARTCSNRASIFWVAIFRISTVTPPLRPPDCLTAAATFQPPGNGGHMYTDSILANRTPVCKAKNWASRSMHLPTPPAVILIEEPENGIHPKRLQEIVRMLRTLVEQSGHTQILMTSHSPYLLDEFQADEVTLCRKDEHGAIQTRRFSEIEHRAASSTSSRYLLFPAHHGRPPPAVEAGRSTARPLARRVHHRPAWSTSSPTKPACSTVCAPAR